MFTLINICRFLLQPYSNFRFPTLQVTLALCLVGGAGWIRGAVVFVAQLVGGIAAAAVVQALFPGPLVVRTQLGPGVSVTRGLFIEMFLTAELVLSVLFLAAEKHKGTFLAPIGIGLALFIAELAGELQIM
jgi:aquaporin rerated protein, other eukaryote